MEILAIFVAVASLAYGIYQYQDQRLENAKLNKQAQSNFENQYSLTTKDMEASGFNPMAMFNGGSLNNYTGSSGFSPSTDNPMESLLDVFKNNQANSLRRNEIENQKALQEADIDLKKAETVSKLLENENFKAMMQSESGNLFVRKLLSELGLNDSARALNVSMSDYYDEYHDRQQKLQDSINQTNKDIAKLHSDTQKEIQASEQKFQKEIKKIQYLNEHLSAREQDYFARRLAYLQNEFNVSQTIIERVLSDKFLWTGQTIGNYSLLNNAVNKALSTASKSADKSPENSSTFAKELTDLIYLLTSE